MVDADDRIRADARFNRERILAAARSAFTENAEASMQSIAKAAGVGQGTLYRHFPTREALVLGVYRKGIDDLVALGPTLAASYPPLKALRLWCERFAEYGRQKRGVADLVRAAMTDELSRDTYGRMVGAVRTLLAACAEKGDLRPDFDPEDFLQLLALLLQLPPTAEGDERAARLRELALRGLGVGSGH